MIFDRGDKILFIGDSISDYSRAKPVGEGLFNAWGTSYVACAGALLGCMYPEEHLRVVNMGIDGNQCRDLEKRWQTDVMDQHPDWVSVLIGINDVWRQFDTPALTERAVQPAEYEENLTAMLESLAGRVQGVFLLTPYIMEPCREDRMRARMDEYGAICRRLAEKYGCIFVDLQAMFDRYFRYRHSSFIAWDRIHPNQIGATLIAREILSHADFDYQHVSP